MQERNFYCRLTQQAVVITSAPLTQIVSGLGTSAGIVQREHQCSRECSQRFDDRCALRQLDRRAGGC